MSVTVNRRVINMTAVGARGQSAPHASVDCTVVGTNNLNLIPKAGYAISGDGADQRFRGRAAATNTGSMSADVNGLIGENRQIRLANGDQVPAGLIRKGQQLEIQFVADPDSPIAFLWELIHPAPGAAPDAGESPYEARRAFYTARNIQIASAG